MRGMAPHMKAKIMLKKMMIAGLMTATVLGSVAPAYAQRGDDGGWRGRGEQSARQGGGDGQRGRGWQGGGEARQQSQQRWEQRRVERPVTQPDRPRVEQRWGSQGQVSRDTARQGWRGDTRTIEQRSADRDVRGDWRNQRNDDRRDGRAEWNRNDRDRRGDWRNDDRRDGRWSNNNNRNWSGDRRFDDRTRWSNQRRWDSGWRQDRRYDWSSYRSRYGDRYRIGRYYAPRGWNYGYRRYSIGIYLNSLLFSNSYWIDDPYSYRLPPAYGSLRWVRYYDDALLVDLRDGYVVDVIHDFFW